MSQTDVRGPRAAAVGNGLGPQSLEWRVQLGPGYVTNAGFSDRGSEVFFFEVVPVQSGAPAFDSSFVNITGPESAAPSPTQSPTQSPQPPESQQPSAPSSPRPGLDEGSKIGLGVGLGAGIPFALLLGVAVGLCVGRARRRAAGVQPLCDDPSSGPPDGGDGPSVPELDRFGEAPRELDSNPELELHAQHDRPEVGGGEILELAGAAPAGRVPRRAG